MHNLRGIAAEEGYMPARQGEDLQYGEEVAHEPTEGLPRGLRRGISQENDGAGGMRTVVQYTDLNDRSATITYRPSVRSAGSATGSVNLNFSFISQKYKSTY